MYSGQTLVTGSSLGKKKPWLLHFSMPSESFWALTSECIYPAKEHSEQEEYHGSWVDAVCLAYSINDLKKIYRYKVEWMKGEVISIKKQEKWEMPHHGMLCGPM